MRKRKRIKRMSRKFLSGLLCIMLAVSSAAPVEIQVLASEVQTQELDENTDDTWGEYSENTVETQIMDEINKSDETEVPSTAQTQSVEENEEISDKENAENTETGEDTENVESEESEEMTETEMTENHMDNRADPNGAEGKITWNIVGGRLFIGVKDDESLSEPNFQYRPLWKSYASKITSVEIGGPGSLVNASYMLAGLTEVTSVNLTAFKTDKLENTSHMFDGCVKLGSINWTLVSGPNVKNMSYMFQDCRALDYYPYNTIETGSVENMSNMFAGCINLTSVPSMNTAHVKDMSGMFAGCEKLKTIDLNQFDTGNVEDMSKMFASHRYSGDSLRCAGLESITFGGNTANVINMSYMFSECKSLKSINLTTLDTSNVTNMSYMFYGCFNLVDIVFGGQFDTSNVTNMSYMFAHNSLNRKDLTNLNTGSVTNMSGMFSACRGLDNEKLQNLDTHSVENMSYMFSGCGDIEELDISSFDTKNVTNMSNMFASCLNLKKGNLDIDTKNVTDMSNMFNQCENLEDITFGSDFQTANVTNMSHMFNQCYKLKDLDLSSFCGDYAENMSFMLNGCSSLETVVLPHFNNGSLTNMSYMLYNCKSLKSVDFSNLNTSQVTNMSYMLGSCSSLETLDLTSLNTRNVMDMSGMLVSCSSLTELNVTNFDTRNVTNMSGMLAGCSSLTELDLTNFNTGRVRNMSNMLAKCSSLTELDLTNFDTSWVTDMTSMLYNCSSLKELDLRNFDLRSIQSPYSISYGIFQGCTELSVIHTPRNLRYDVSLPTKDADDKWYRSGGVDAVVTALPKDSESSDSILLMKNKPFEYPCISAEKIKTDYSYGEAISLDDLTVTYYNAHGAQTILTDEQYTTNVDELDLDKTGSQTLVVRYEQTAEEAPLEASVEINITGKTVVEISGITMEDTVYHAERVSYQGTAVVTDKTTKEPIDIPLVYSYKGERMDGTPYTENEKPPINAGYYTLVVAVAQNNALYTGSREFEFTISKAPVVITADDVVVIRNYELPQNPKYTYKVQGLCKEDSLIKEPLFDINADLSTVGVYSITPSGADAGGNYEISYVEGTFTVSDKRAVKITGIEIGSMTYNASPISYKGEAAAKLVDNDGSITQEDVTEEIGELLYTYSGILADGMPYNETSDAPKDAGSYTLKVTVSDSNERYIGTTEYPFEIYKAPVTITAENISVYVEENLPEAFPYKTEGFFHNDGLVKEPSFQCTADTSKEGTYEIVPFGAEAGMNYEIFYESGLLTVRENGGLIAEAIPHQVYTGKAIKPTVRVFFDNKILLTSGKDYTVKYFNNINADTDNETKRKTEISRDGTTNDGFTKEMAYVVITGKGNYAGTVYRNFYIDPVTISKDGINETEGVVLKYKDQLVINKKKAQKTFQSIKYKKSMKLNQDFVLSLTAEKAYAEDGKELPTEKEFLEKNVPVIPKGSYGTFELKIEGINNYRGTLTKTVYVTEKAHLMKNAKITLGKNLKSVTFTSGGVRLTPAFYDEKGDLQYITDVSTFKDVSSLNDAFTVFMGKECLKYGEDKNYIVKYKNNHKVGTATLIIEGKGEYMGTKRINFKITGTPFTAKTVTINKFRETMTYTGKACRQDDLELKDNDGNVIDSSCYTLLYKNNVKTGTASVTITANPASGYIGNIKKSYKIMAADIATVATVVPADKLKDKIESKEGGACHLNGTVIYKKEGVKPINRISLLLGANWEKPITLVEKKDYVVTYTNNTSAASGGTPTMTITGKGNLTGTLTVTFDISKAPLESAETLSVKAAEVPYKEKNQESYQYQPKIKVTDGKKALKEGTDYTIKEYVHCSQKDVQAYLDAKINGSSESILQSLRPYAVIAATDSGDYSGIKEVDLTIYDTKMTASTLYVVIMDNEDYAQTTYTGAQIRPNVEVYYGAAKAVKEAKKANVTDSTTLTSEQGKYKLTKLKRKQGQNNGDYTLEYGVNIKAGKNKGSISVIGVGKYGGKVTTKFTIQGEDVFGSQVEPWSLFANKMKLILAQ